MAYEFVADAEKMEELHNDLVNTANDLTSFIEDIYTKVDDLNTVWSGDSYNSFKSRCDSYKVSLNQLPAILNAFAVELGTLGGDANTMAVSIKALLDCSDMTIQAGSSGTSTVQFKTRAKDANGAYIPTTGDYSGGISIPNNTTLGEDEDCTAIGNSIYNSTMEMRKKLSKEMSDIVTYSSRRKEAIEALDTAQQAALNKYIREQIDARQSIIYQIDAAITSGYTTDDGPIYNATSYDLTGNVALGVTVSDQDAVNSSVAAARSINNEISDLSSMSSIEAYMLDCGLDSIGG